jgi:predicted AAA+ superfamily ATPase
MFTDTYLVHLAPRHGKTNERMLAPKKIYAADCGIRTLFTGFRDKGGLFENYVYLKIKHRRPSYVYKNGIEIDFITEDKVLIEVKYGLEMTEKQRALFASFPADKKMIVDSLSALRDLDTL